MALLAVVQALFSEADALDAPGIRFSTGFLINGIPFRPLLSAS